MGHLASLSPRLLSRSGIAHHERALANQFLRQGGSVCALDYGRPRVRTRWGQSKGFRAVAHGETGEARRSFSPSRNPFQSTASLRVRARRLFSSPSEQDSYISCEILAFSMPAGKADYSY